MNPVYLFEFIGTLVLVLFGDGVSRLVYRAEGTGKPVVLVLFGGRAQVISAIASRCAAIIQAWYPGEEGGHLVFLLNGHTCSLFSGQ